MNNKNVMKVLSVTLVLSLLVAILPVKVSQVQAAASLCVDPEGINGCFNTIQGAVTAAAAGDTINIHAGTYVEDISADKAINFIGEVDALGNPLPLIEGTLEINLSSAPSFAWSIENLNFKVTDNHTLILKSNITRLTVKNCVFDGSNLFKSGFNGIEMPSSPHPELSVENSVFKNGLYVSIDGYAKSIVVKNSTFTNVKSGINIQGGSGNTVSVENSNFSVIAQGVTNDTYGVRFASSGANTGGNLSITGSSFVVDKNGLVADHDHAYHSAIIVRAGAKGPLKAAYNQILGEVVNQSRVPLNAENNWWGSTDGPSSGMIIGNVDYDPWLKLFVDLDNLSIDENQPIGTVVGNLSGVNGDPDEVFTYRLAAATLYPDNLKFKIEGNQLKSKAVFNYEDDDEYKIGVIVEDAWENTAERPFTISINDVNEEPILKHIDEQEVEEGDPVTFTAKLQDDDDLGQTYTFSLEGAPVGATIVPGTLPNTGDFSWSTDEDDGPGSYTFTVRICDNGVPKKCDSQAVTITVDEVNAPPTANNDAYWFKVGTTRVVPAPGVLGNDTDTDKPDNTLTAEIVTPPAAGSIVLSPEGSFTYVPPTETACSGPYTFTYKVSDGQGGLSATAATVTLTCKEGNVNPTDITLDPPSKNENLRYEGTLTAVDTDDDEEETDPGTVQHAYALIPGVGDDDNAKFEIQPGTNELKSKAILDFETQSVYHIHVQATDPFGGSFDKPLTITVNDMNDAPVLDPIVYDPIINEGESLEFTAIADDEDSGDTLTYSISGAPSGAIIDPITGRFTWTPTEEIKGPKDYKFDVIVTDSGGELDKETIKVTVKEVNVAPVLAAIGSKTFTENAAPSTFYIEATDADLPRQALRYGVEGQPANLWVNSLTGAVYFRPDEEQGGNAYTFKFKVCDNGKPSLCDDETVRFTVTEDNQKPVAKGESYAVIGSQLVVDEPGVLANDTDADIPADTLKVGDRSALAGLVLNNDGSFTYTVPTPKPAAGYVTFTYKASDGELQSDLTATVYLLIDNHVPTDILLDDDTVSEGEAKYEGTLTTVDPDIGDVFTYEKVAGIGDSDNALFTINKDQLILNGPFDYETKNIYNVRIRSTDLFGKSVEKALSIHVDPENDAPIAISQDSLVTLVGESLDITLTGSDPEGDALTFAIFSEPKHGQLKAVEVERISVQGNGILRIVEPQLTYVPDEDYLGGYDSFTFKARDVHGAMSDLAIVNIIVNDVPVAEPDAYPATEDTELIVDAELGVLANDDNIVEVPPFKAEKVSGPSHGELHLEEDGSFTYMPEANYNGVDTFTYKACEGSDCSNIATVTINIAAVNDAPVANDMSVETDEDTTKWITLNVSDVDGDALMASIVTQPAHGTATASGTLVVYAPNADWNGSDSFTYKVSDGTVNSDEATVSITVTPVNDAPIANDMDVDVDEDTPEEITLDVSDVDNPDEDMVVTILAGPSHGTAVVNGIVVTYAPTAGFSGEDAFSYKVSDGELESLVKTVSITVAEVNDAPIAEDLFVETMENQPVEIELIATDADGDPLTFEIMIEPEHGTLECEGPLCTYTPEAGWSGTDSFTYIANDGELDSNEATVEITVHPLPIFRIYLPLILK